MPPLVAQRVDRDASAERRTLDERIQVRWPAIQRIAGGVVFRLSPASRLRQRLLRRMLLSGWSAFSRRDFALMVTRYARDSVYEGFAELVTLGIPSRTAGRDAWMATIADWSSAWSEQRMTLSFVLDAGSTLIALGRIRLRGVTSGAEADVDVAQVLEVRSGLVTRERDYADWSAGLAAAGIDPGVLASIDRLDPGASVTLAPR